MSKWPSYVPDTWIKDYEAKRFSMLAHTTSTINDMKSAIDLALKRNIGYIYVTDDGMPNPWNRLPTFWNEQVEYIEKLNDNLVDYLAFVCILTLF